MFEPVERRVDSTPVVFSKKRARERIISASSTIWFFTFSIFLLSLISPVFGAFASGVMVWWWWHNFEEEFFDSTKRGFYRIMFTPLLTATHYIRIGYEVYEEDLAEHIAILKNKDFKKLGEIWKRVKNSEPWRIVGAALDLLTRHLWILGATGAGKSSLVMTAFQQVFRRGGGCIYVDGKSEVKLAQKFYSLAKKEGREQDLYVVNTLKPEISKEETNTFSPIATLPPMAQVEFLASLIFQGGGGDMAYWEGRGKALLTPVVFSLAFRKIYYGEPYTFRNILNAISSSEYAFYSTILSAIAFQMDEELVKDPNLSPLISAAKSLITPSSPVKTLEVVENYLVMYPFERATLRNHGYDPDFVSDLFRAFSNAIVNYAKTLSSPWGEALVEAGKNFRAYCSSKGHNILKLSIEKLRELFNDWIRGEGKEWEEKVLELPEKALTQHGYAQQQWTRLFNVFEVYSHIFGSLEPEVDMIDVLANNKLLYFLLPPLEQDPSTTEILGRAIVSAIRSASAVALGYKLHGVSSTQQTIIESLIKPTPIGLVVLDEYGAYPVPGIDVIFAQCRSIRVSTWIATQDLTSARVGGKDEGSLLRAFANTNKLILGIKDIETLQKVSQVVPSKKILSRDSYTVVDGAHEIAERTATVKEVSPVEVIKELTKFETGFSYAFIDGRDAFVQINYADEEPTTIRLNKNRVVIKRV